MTPEKRLQSIAALVLGAVLCAALYFFPLVRITPLRKDSTTGGFSSKSAQAPTFDPAATAARIWQGELVTAAQHAVELTTVLPLVRDNPAAAKDKFAKSAGLGAAYFFVRGAGRILRQDRGFLRVAVDGNEAQVIALRIGPIFGNTIRDGCGFLDVNAFPGLQEFNALSAELNALIEKNLLPSLRTQGVVGATVSFAGCSEAPENAPEAGEPILTIIPVRAEVR